MNSETVFSFRSDELQHSLYSTIRISSNVSVEKHLASLELINGPPKKRASKSLILSMAVMASELVEATMLAEEAIPLGVALLIV